MKRKLWILAMTAFVAVAATSRPLQAERTNDCLAARCSSDSGCAAGCKCRMNVDEDDEGRCATA